MKALLISLLRHALTALAGVGTLLVSNGLIEPEDAAAVNASGASMADALVVVTSALVARLLMQYGGRFFTVLRQGKVSSLALWCMGLAGFLVLGLSSCAYLEDAAVPVRACYESRHGRVCVDLNSGK